MLFLVLLEMGLLQVSNCKYRKL